MSNMDEEPNDRLDSSRGMNQYRRRVTIRVPVSKTNRSAFEQYVIPEIDVLLRVAHSMTRNSADAEDLVQDTLLRAYRAIDRFDGRYPRAWLFTILRNTHINRNRRKRPESLRDPDGTSSQIEQVAGSEQTDASVENSFDVEIEHALAALDEPFRRVVELVDIGGLSYTEAAKTLGIPIGTIMSRLHRARSQIRDQLEQTGIAPRRHE